MADQIAVTIENARLISESQLVISQLETLTNENTRQNWKTELSTDKPMYRYTATGVHSINKAVTDTGENVLDVPLVLRGQTSPTRLQRRQRLL